jgi:hypothetical protein
MPAVNGDLELFRRAVLPFGPMDLTVQRADKDEVTVLRLLYLGAVGQACHVDAVSLSRSFHCGPGCTKQRRDDLVSKLDEIKTAVGEFASLGNVGVVSQWGRKNEYRLDNLYVMLGSANEAQPSKIMGFVPSSSWTPVRQVPSFLRGRGVSEEKVSRLVSRMRDLSLAAVVRDPLGTRVIRVGIGTRQSGLLFLKIGKALPQLGAQIENGGKYVHLQEIEKGVVFYETS